MDPISRYLDLVDDYMRRHPDERVGQAHYNALRLEWPHFQHEIAGTQWDCFSDDGRLPAFLDWAERALADDQRAAARVSGHPLSGGCVRPHACG